MERLLAEDLVLLGIDQERHEIVADALLLFMIGSAALLELALLGAVDVPPGVADERAAPVRVVGEADDALLARGLDWLAEEPRCAFNAIVPLGVLLQPGLVQRLGAQGLLRVVPRSWWGRPARWAATVPDVGGQPRRRLRLLLETDAARMAPSAATWVALVDTALGVEHVLGHAGGERHGRAERVREIGVRVRWGDLQETAPARVVRAAQNVVHIPRLSPAPMGS